MRISIFKLKVQGKRRVLPMVVLLICIVLFLTQFTLADPAEELKEYYLNQNKEIATPSYTQDRTVINYEKKEINTNYPPIAQVTERIEDNTSPNWYPFIHLTGKAGDDRQLGRFDFMSPLWQSPNSIFFSDIRCTFDNEDSVEGNMGMGFRRIIPGRNENADWIWGIYTFYDILKSPNGNKFNQGTFGIEMLKTNFELRGNVYFPEDKKYEIANRTIDSITLSGTSVMQRTQSLAAFERALPGFDAQVGYGFDISEKDKLWIHAGYFNFNHSDSPEIAGPRLSLTYELNDVFGIPDSILNIGAEYQKDDVRDTRTFACISLSIPFGTTFERLMGIEKRQNTKRRMMRPVVRDVDVITNADNINGAPGLEGGPEIVSDTEAPVVDSASGEQVDMYFISANGSSAGLGTQESPMTIVQAESASGISDILFLVNDDDGIDVNSIAGGTLTLKPYQQILGIGDNTSKDILLPNDLTFTVYSNAGRPSLTHPGYNADVVKMVYNNTIDGITISGGSDGIYGQNVSNPNIRDVTIQDANDYGIYFANASGTVTISESDFQNNNLGAIYLSNTSGGTTNISILNNNISNNTGRGFYAQSTNGSTLTGSIQNNTISGNGTQGMYIYNTTNGVAEIDIISNQITGNTNEGLRLFNYTGGTITATVQDNLISENQDDNIYCYNNASTMNLVMNNNNISNSPVDLGLRIYNIADGSIFSGDITNNTISGNLNQGLYMYNTGSSFSVTTRNNTITANQAGGIDYDTDAGTSTLTIENNIISNNIGGAATNDIGIAIDQDTDPNSTLTLTLNNNVVANNGYTGIRLDNADGTFDASLTGNTINNNGTDGVYAINQTTGIFTADFSDNTITQNSARGLWLYNNTGTMNSKLENNTIAMNIDDGLELDNINSGIFDFDLGGGTLSSAGQNSIFANTSGFDIDNDTGASISAESNWWGLILPNPARFAGTVDYNPWLTSDPN